MSATPFAVPVDNEGSTLAADYAVGSGVVQLQPGAVAAILAITGALSATNWLRFTLLERGAVDTYGNVTDSTKLTIFKATGANSGTNQLSGVVAIEGTTDRIYHANDFFEVWITRGTLADIHTAVNNLESAAMTIDGSKTFSSPLVCNPGTQTDGSVIVFRVTAGTAGLTSDVLRVRANGQFTFGGPFGATPSLNFDGSTFAFIDGTFVNVDFFNCRTRLSATAATFAGTVLVGAISAGSANAQFEVQATTSSTPIFAGYTSTGGAPVWLVDHAGCPSSPGAGTNCERFGAGSTASVLQATAFGHGATASASNATAFGFNASVTVADSVAFGAGASTGATSQSVAVGVLASVTGSNGVAIGYVSSASASNTIAIGVGASSAFAGSIVLATSAAATAAAQFVAGSAAVPINDVYFGKGVINATPTAYAIHGTGGSGTNITGGDLTMAGGQGTGTGAGGAVRIKVAPAGTAGSAANALADALVIDSTKAATFVARVIAPAFLLSRKTVTAAVTLVATDASFVAITATGSAYTITLPAANAVPAGFAFTFKDESGAAGTNHVTISPAGTDTAEAALSLSTNYGVLRTYSDGVSKWFLL